jgi:hypothetical protein
VKSARPSSKPSTKSTKGKPAPAPAPASNNQPKRKTGPGGIYIPPPSQWFN